jgi:hypothetical protein
MEHKDFQIELQMRMNKFRIERNWYLVIGTTIFMFLIIRIAALLASHHKETEGLQTQIDSLSKPQTATKKSN